MVKHNEQKSLELEFRRILNSYILLNSLITVHKLNLFSDLKIQKLSVEEYCKNMNMKSGKLRPILRILEDAGFIESDKGFIQLTSRGEVFSDSQNSWLNLLTLTMEEYLPASLKTYEALFLNETAYELAHKSNPWSRRSKMKIGKVFDEWLDTETQNTSGLICKFLQENGLLGNSFVDIGGGMGSVARQE